MSRLFLVHVSVFIGTYEGVLASYRTFVLEEFAREGAA